MKRFVFKICYSQTDQVYYIIHAMHRGEAYAKADDIVTNCRAHHWDYVCEIAGEVK